VGAIITDEMTLLSALQRAAYDPEVLGITYNHRPNAGGGTWCKPAADTKAKVSFKSKTTYSSHLPSTFNSMRCTGT
jgi:hypothetical protein